MGVQQIGDFANVATDRDRGPRESVARGVVRLADPEFAVDQQHAERCVLQELEGPLGGRFGGLDGLPHYGFAARSVPTGRDALVSDSPVVRSHSMSAAPPVLTELK